jgi:hypothetical protein
MLSHQSTLKKTISYLCPKWINELLAELKFLLVGNQWLGNITISDHLLSTGLDKEIDFYLRNSSLIYEWGSGYSTLKADLYGIPIFSVENHLFYASSLSKRFSNDTTILSVRSLGFANGPFGRPLSFVPINFYNHLSYCIISEHPEGILYDLFIIDGRCRLLCLLSCLKYVNKIRIEQASLYSPKVLIDDVSRQEYRLPQAFARFSHLSPSGRVLCINTQLIDNLPVAIELLANQINHTSTRLRFL